VKELLERETSLITCQTDLSLSISISLSLSHTHTHTVLTQMYGFSAIIASFWHQAQSRATHTHWENRQIVKNSFSLCLQPSINTPF